MLEQKLFFIIIDFSDSRAAPDLVKNTKGSSTLVFLQLIVVKTESWALFAVTSNQTLFDDDEKKSFAAKHLPPQKWPRSVWESFHFFNNIPRKYYSKDSNDTFMYRNLKHLQNLNLSG